MSDGLDEAIQWAQNLAAYLMHLAQERKEVAVLAEAVERELAEARAEVARLRRALLETEEEA